MRNVRQDKLILYARRHFVARACQQSHQRKEEARGRFVMNETNFARVLATNSLALINWTNSVCLKLENSILAS